MDNNVNEVIGIQDMGRKMQLRYWLARYIQPINRKKVVFSQFGGKGYGFNPKAICDEFLKRNDGYDLVWILGKGTSAKKAGIPKGVRTVTEYRAVLELLTAKVWINNIHFNIQYQRGAVKRPGTIYLNTFHGGITLKNVGTDKKSYRADKELNIKEQMFLKDCEYVDYATIGCETERHVVNEFFNGQAEILKLGDARTDILINGSEAATNKVRAFFKIPEDAKVCIYAPTFREDMKLHWYNLNYEQILDTLEERTKSPWVMLIRLHPRLAAQTKEIMPDSPRFINAGRYVDMQELTVASDLMISDYSSAITDFMLTRQPAFMYVPDLDKYLKKRGMYFKMEELPFPYAKTTDELIERIRNFDEELYQKKTEQFIEQIGCINDGKSAERIVDFLIQKMKGK